MGSANGTGMSLIPDDAVLQQLAAAIGERLLARGQWLACAESCTGGLIAKLCTDIAGSSRWFERGLVTYSDAAKQNLLGVPAEVIDGSGAVSAATVQAMVHGLLAHAPVQWALAVSGIAGPGGGSADKPVGTVWIAWGGSALAASCSRFLFQGDRDAVRRQAAEAALRGLDLLLQATEPPPGA
jgi:nicotinamide-nucleotide amidase